MTADHASAVLRFVREVLGVTLDPWQARLICSAFTTPPARPACGRRPDGTLICRPANLCRDCPLPVASGTQWSPVSDITVITGITDSVRCTCGAAPAGYQTVREHSATCPISTY